MGIIVADRRITQQQGYDGYFNVDDNRTYDGYLIINITSRVAKASNPDIKRFFPLSPMYMHDPPLEVPLTPYKLPDGSYDQDEPWLARCVENPWQYMKCWKLVDTVDGWYSDWVKRRIGIKRKVRWPYDKKKWYGNVDLFERRIIPLHEARERLYLEIYRQHAERSPKLLDELVERSHKENIALWEFDCVDLRKTGGSIKGALRYPHYLPWGHAYALAWILKERRANIETAVEESEPKPFFISTKFEFKGLNEMSVTDSSTEIDINLLDPNPYNPRKPISVEDIQELSESVKEAGIIQPLIIAPNGKRFIIVAGHRRYAAALHLDLKKVPCVIRNINEKELIQFSLIENLQREDLTAVEEARAIARLKENDNSLSIRDLAKIIGKSKTFVEYRLSILDLPADLQDAIDDNRIPYRKALELKNIENQDLRGILIERSKEGDLEEFKQIIQKEIEDAEREPVARKTHKWNVSQAFWKYVKQQDSINITKERLSIKYDSEENLKGLLNKLIDFLSESEPEKMPAEKAVPAEVIEEE